MFIPFCQFSLPSLAFLWCFIFISAFLSFYSFIFRMSLRIFHIVVLRYSLSSSFGSALSAVLFSVLQVSLRYSQSVLQQFSLAETIKCTSQSSFLQFCYFFILIAPRSQLVTFCSFTVLVSTHAVCIHNLCTTHFISSTKHIGYNKFSFEFGLWCCY